MRRPTIVLAFLALSFMCFLGEASAKIIKDRKFSNTLMEVVTLTNAGKNQDALARLTSQESRLKKLKPYERAKYYQFKGSLEAALGDHVRAIESFNNAILEDALPDAETDTINDYISKLRLVKGEAEAIQIAFPDGKATQEDALIDIQSLALFQLRQNQLAKALANVEIAYKKSKNEGAVFTVELLKAGIYASLNLSDTARAGELTDELVEAFASPVNLSFARRSYVALGRNAEANAMLDRIVNQTRVESVFSSRSEPIVYVPLEVDPLLAKSLVGGEISVRYTVAADGRIDNDSVEVLRSTVPAEVEAPLRKALAFWQFQVFEVAGLPVRRDNQTSKLVFSPQDSEAVKTLTDERPFTVDDVLIKAEKT